MGHTRPGLTVEIDVAELAVRMSEACYGLIRPCPNASEALAAMNAAYRDAWMRAANASIDYVFKECFPEGGVECRRFGGWP